MIVIGFGIWWTFAFAFLFLFFFEIACFLFSTSNDVDDEFP